MNLYVYRAWADTYLNNNWIISPPELFMNELMSSDL